MRDPFESPAPRRLPDGRLQSDVILKEDHAKNLKDVAELKKLSADLETELEKSGEFVLSAAALKLTEDMEKLLKRIRGRIRRN